jgi:hypothetical protein
LVLPWKAWETDRVSEETTLPRPAQVTVSAVMIMASSVIVVLLAYTGISELRSLSTREAVESALGREPLASLGISVEQALSGMKLAAIVAGCCAAAASIFGFFVMKRDRTARLALTVLAVPLFVSGVVIGGFAASLVVFASLMLWAQPARDWFNGVHVPQPSAAGVGLRSGGFGGPPRNVNTSTPIWPAPTDAHALPQVDVNRRPATVLWSAVLTWICAGVVGLVAAVAIAVLAADPDQVMQEIQRQQPEVAQAGVTQDALVMGMLILGLLVVVWSVAACVIAAFAFRGAGWARLLLLASATVATVLMATTAAGAPFLIPFIVAGVATIVMLMRPDARQWFRTRAQQRLPLL